MDNELKKILDLEKQILELKAALEKERMKAEVLNQLIETVNEQLGVNAKKIIIPGFPDVNKSNP